jgi:hypothetical protein
MRFTPIHRCWERCVISVFFHARAAHATLKSVDIVGCTPIIIVEKNYKSFILSFFYGVANPIMTWFLLGCAWPAFTEILVITARGTSGFGISLHLTATVFVWDASHSDSSFMSQSDRFRHTCFQSNVRQPSLLRRGLMCTNICLKFTGLFRFSMVL